MRRRRRGAGEEGRGGGKGQKKGGGVRRGGHRGAEEKEEGKEARNGKETRRQHKPVSDELPGMEIMAARDLGEYRVSFVSILQSELYVRWQSLLDCT